MFHPLLRRLRLRHKTSARASGDPPGGRRLAGEERHGRCTAEQSYYDRFYPHNGKFTLAAMYFRRVRAIGRSFAAALAHVSAAVAPPAPAAHNLGAGL